MKKFLVFVVICIVTLSLGLTSYYFLRDDETILITKTYYSVNVGELFSLEIERENPNITTEITYESLHPSVIEFNPTLSESSFMALKGGKAVIKISTNKSSFIPVTVEVEVGDGSSSAPLFISTAEELANIGINSNLSLDSYYALKNDIDLSTYNDGEWRPIGNFASVYDESNMFVEFNENLSFNGSLDGRGYSIYSLDVTHDDYLYVDNTDINTPIEHTGSIVNAGLFTELSDTAVVKNLNIINPLINGSYETVGAIAGKSYGTIERVNISDGVVMSIDSSAIVGNVVGLMGVANQKVARVDRVSANSTIDSTNILGGLVGINNGGIIINSYFAGSMYADSTTVAGGIVGINAFAENSGVVFTSAIKDCYSSAGYLSDEGTKGGIIGTNTNYDDLVYPNRYYGVYYSTETAGNVSGISTIEDANLPENFGIYNKTVEELKDQLTYYSYTNIQDADIDWIFNKVWLIEQAEGFPYLNMEGAKVADNIGIVISDNTIGSISQLQLIRDDLAGDHVIEADISLSGINDWIPIGTLEEPFTGSLHVRNNSVISNMTITSNNVASGLFGYVGATAVIDGVILQDVNISGGDNVGAIAGVSQGLIVNCQVANITLTEVEEGSGETPEDACIIYGDSNSEECNIGGIVGKNDMEGTVENCYTDVILRPDTSSTCVTNVGGLVGNNVSGFVLDSNSITDIESVGPENIYIGGLVGYNNASVESSCFNGNIIANTVSTKTVVGGLVGYNGKNSTLKYCSASEGTFEGCCIGGIVGISNGVVDQCYISVLTITGKYIGGLAYVVSQNTISNCRVDSNLCGVSSSSVKGGFAYFISYHSSSKYGVVEYCFSSATFNELGDSYAETYALVRTEYPLSIRDAGYIRHSIYDKDTAQESAIIQSFNFLGFNLNFLVADDEEEIPVSTDHAKGNDGKEFSTFSSQGFKDSIWNKVSGDYPSLINVATA